MEKIKSLAALAAFTLFFQVFVFCYFQRKIKEVRRKQKADSIVKVVKNDNQGR